MLDISPKASCYQVALATLLGKSEAVILLHIPHKNFFPFITKGAHLETVLFGYLMTLGCGYTCMPQHTGF